MSNRNDTGHFYIATIGGRTKIGWSRDPAQRMRDYGRDLTRAVVFSASVPLALEKAFHEAAGSDGEWYSSFDAALVNLRLWLSMHNLPLDYRLADQIARVGRRRIGQPLSVTFTDAQREWLEAKIPPGGTLTASVRAAVDTAMEVEAQRKAHAVKK